MKKFKPPQKIWLFIFVILLIPLHCSALDTSIENISAKTSASLIEKYQEDPGFVLLDIRTPAEFKAGHISDAVMLDFYSTSFAQDFSRLDRNKTYLVYCRSGNRSGQLMRAIRDLGFKKVYNMEHGLVDWAREEYRLTTS